MKPILNCLAFSVFCFEQAIAQVLPKDVIINEILFNPVKDGFDYVEGYNRSSRYIFLNELMIANRNATGDLASMRILAKDSVTIQPGQYFVITANEKWVRQHYRVPASAKFVELSSLPSYPDDEGTVVILRRRDSSVIDEIHYSHKWHFELISDVTGVALERVSINGVSQNLNNWTSAASTIGHGTPGYQNSQSREDNEIHNGISVLPKVFSPDNDGKDDFVQIEIGSAWQGKVANAVIFDATGRRIRNLIKNELLGNKNVFTWDGLNDRAQKSPPGIYILFAQIFDTRGYMQKVKSCMVLR